MWVCSASTHDGWWYLRPERARVTQQFRYEDLRRDARVAAAKSAQLSTARREFYRMKQGQHHLLKHATDEWLAAPRSIRISGDQIASMSVVSAARKEPYSDSVAPSGVKTNGAHAQVPRSERSLPQSAGLHRMLSSEHVGLYVSEVTRKCVKSLNIAGRLISIRSSRGMP